MDVSIMADMIPDDQVKIDPPAATEPPSQGMSPIIPDDQVKVDTAHGEIPDNQVELDSDKYSTPGQEIGTAVEGVAQGLLGPVATMAEKGLSKLGVPGMSDEDITGRANANPWVHGISKAAGFGAGLLTGTGEAALLGKVGEAGAAAAGLGEATLMAKVGSGIIRGAIENGLYQGGDEISKAMLGQGDPEAPVAAALTNMGAAALLGGGVGGLLGGVGYGVKKATDAMKDQQIGTKMQELLTGIGIASREWNAGEMAAKVPGTRFAEIVANGNVQKGVDLYNKAMVAGLNKASDVASDFAGMKAGAVIGTHVGGPVGTVVGGLVGAGVGKMAEGLAEKVIGGTTRWGGNKFALPVIMKLMTSNTGEGVAELLNHSEQIASGAKAMSAGINNLFTSGASKAINTISDESRQANREKLRKYIDSGAFNDQMNAQLAPQQPAQPQNYAEGGSVAPIMPEAPTKEAAQPLLAGTDALATHYPEQAMLMSAAKARVNNYLTSVKPQAPIGQLPFDSQIKNKDQEKTYNQALDIANHPISILDHVKNGTLDASHMKHFTSMYPEIYNQMSKQMTQKIMEAKIKGQKPDYKVRQGMSLFLGAPMDSTFTPASIQAAQSVYANKAQQAAPNAPVTKNKSNTSKLDKVSKSYMTDDQARDQRQNKV